MKSSVVAKSLVIAALCSSSASPALAQSAPPARSEEVYVYYLDELDDPGTAVLPGAVIELHQQQNPTVGDPVFASCRAATPQIAPFLVPLALFGFNMLARVVESDLSRRERQRLEALSRTFTQVRSDEAFPGLSENGALRCLVVDRVTRIGAEYELGATYVLGLRRVGDTAFTVEPVAARIDSSNIINRERPPAMNATVSVTFQSVVTDGEGTNQLLTLPAYSMSFQNLQDGVVGFSTARRSPVLPIPAQARSATGPSAAPAPGTPMSVAVAVTEGHVELTRVKERIAMEQANRAALTAAVGEALKGALTD